MQFCLVVLTIVSAIAVSTAQQVSWPRQELLDPDAHFILMWNPHLDPDGFFHFSLKADTRGYLGFGISDTGTMAGADLVIAWPEKGTNNVTLMDLHASQNGLPREDSHSDWHLKSSTFNTKAGTFQVTLARKAAAFNEDDLPIRNGSVQIIYSWGNAPALEHHGTNRRGAKIIKLLEEANSGLILRSSFQIYILVILIQKTIMINI